MLPSLFKALEETLFMVFTSGFLSLVLGLPLGILLSSAHSKRNSKRNSKLSKLSFFNLMLQLVESLPYIILMLTIIPLARWSSENTYHLQIGPSIVAILPLTLITTPILSRFIAEALNRVPLGLIETLEAMGASRFQILRKCLFPEALNDIIKGFIVSLIYLLGFSMVAGILGYGGLGQLAMNKGYYSFEIKYLIAIALVLTVFVQILLQSSQYLCRDTLKGND